MQPLAKTIERHTKLIDAVEEFLTQMTAYLLLPSLGIKQDPNDSPLRKKVYQDLIVASHNAKSFCLYDMGLVENMEEEIATLRQWGNNDCTAMANENGGIRDRKAQLAALFLACAKANDLSVKPDEDVS